jgi:PilZ domain-containing protein
MTDSAAEKPEARRAPRFVLEQVVAVKSLDGQFDDASGTSRDVSACGVFFYADKCLPVGATVEVFMMMPQTSTLNHGIFPLRCYGAVVRVAPESGRCGIAVAFERVDVIAEA